MSRAAHCMMLDQLPPVPRRLARHAAPRANRQGPRLADPDDTTAAALLTPSVYGPGRAAVINADATVTRRCARPITKSP